MRAIIKKLILSALLMVFANGAYAKEITTVKSTDDPSLGILSIVWKMHTFYDKRNDLSIRVFETGGGDPAMNSNRIVVVIASGRPGVYPLRIWETGVDVSWVKKVEFLDKTLTMSVNEHYFSNGDTKLREAVYKLTYDVKKGTMVVQKSLI